MAQLGYKIGVRVNKGRFEAMKQELLARVRRAPRRDRVAMLHSGIRHIVEKCVHVDLRDVL